jgi:hypothetical protein
MKSMEVAAPTRLSFIIEKAAFERQAAMIWLMNAQLSIVSSGTTQKMVLIYPLKLVLEPPILAHRFRLQIALAVMT